MKPNLITIIGNTGVGKSKLSIDIAKALNGEIINGDSMQVYRGVDTITNKHPIDERENIPHHLPGHIDWSEEYSVQQFEREAEEKINDIQSRGKLPILVGGTHYYNQALLFKNSTIANYQSTKETSASTSESHDQLSLDQLKTLEDPLKVHQILSTEDPAILAKFHPNDTRRLRRALEVLFLTGKRASQIYQEQQDSSIELRYRSLVLWIYCETDELERRLDERVDEMIEQGLKDEVMELYEYQMSHSGIIDGVNGVFQTIGYKEFFPYLRSNNSVDFASGVQQMKLATRQYAKRQTKWVRKKLLVMLEEQLRKRPNCEGYFGALDSTDLSNWKKNVGDRGIQIATDFLNEPPVFSYPLIPDGLEELVSSRGEGFNNQSKWRTYRCDLCLSGGVPMTLVGEKVWTQHMASRRHRKNQMYANRLLQAKPCDSSRKTAYKESVQT